MKDLQLFQNEQFGQLRAHVDENGQVWFCGKDIAVALDYNPESKVGMIFQSVPEEWKGVKPISTPGGPQEMLCLTEQGVYFFLGRSDKPKALPYQKWVAGEILPSIRKTGRYETPKAIPNPSDDSATRRALARTLNRLASRPEYPATRQNIFLAEAAHVLSGNPIERYLPPVTGGRENWLSPTQMGALLNLSGITVGRALMELGLHGEKDPEHIWSEPIHNKAKNCDRQVITYRYNPDYVMPKLREYFDSSDSAGRLQVLNFTEERPL